jgi:uncharacterized protein (DUF2267 family)
MKHDRVEIIDRSVEKTHLWLNELADQLGTEDKRYAYRTLRAVLHALRDRLTVDETAQLAAQLPELVRGIYYEGWDPSRTPATYHGSKPFLDRIAAEATLAGESEASFAAEAVMELLRHHVSAGELEQVLGMLPPKVRAVVEA